MNRQISVKLPIRIYEELRDEALKQHISLSDIIRGKICDQKIEMTKQQTENNFEIVEILFLLREFLFERNAQILKKVDEKMEKRFGKERKKIV